MKTLDINRLRSFVAVAETHSLTRAAARVHRTQSTVSQQLHRLEDSVGERLLHRTQGRVLGLTPAGERVLDHARRLLRCHDETVAALDADALSGTLRLGVADETAHARLAGVLADFRSRHGGVRLTMEALPSDALEARLDAGELDAVVVNRHPRAVGDGAVLYTERLRWLAAITLVRRPGEPLPVAGFPATCAYRACADAALAHWGGDWDMVYVSPGHHAVWTAVTAGLGVAALPEASLPRPLPEGIREQELPAPGEVAVVLRTAPGGPGRLLGALAEAIRCAV
ncbi:LysR family transcriptional regulator [Aquisalimonas asiatica]|nr:LysR substrate-binding domain-containing protein [Aquisalimonas asiatica]